MANQKLSRNKQGNLKPMLLEEEGVSFQEDPLSFFIILARYKFALRFIKKTDHVLDMGCGQGFGSIMMSKFAEKVTGADFDAEWIAYNKKAYSKIKNVDFINLDLLTLKPKQKKYDVVISMDVIEHFPKEQSNLVAKNLAKLTKDSGFAVIGTPNIMSRPYASPRRKEIHPHEFEAEEFKNLLSKYFKRVFLFSMTDEVVSTSFPKMAWYLMALCTK